MRILLRNGEMVDRTMRENEWRRREGDPKAIWNRMENPNQARRK